MRRFWLALLVALAVAAGAATPILAQDEDLDDIDCFEFTFQEEAQAELDADPSDPYNLDPNDDGIACALLPSEEASATPEASPTAQDDEALDADPPANNQRIEAAQDSADADNNQANNNQDENNTQNRNGNNQDNDDNQGNNAQGQDNTNQTREDRQARRERNQNNGNNQAGNNQDDEDVALVCDDFETEEEAQAELDADDTLADSLDTNGDGFACSDGDDVDLPSEEELDEDATGGVFACDDYDTQAEAQAAFEVDPDLLIDLDTNGDGEACSAGDDVDLDDAEVVAVTAGEDLDCIDFDTQEEAQAIYDDDPSDPFNLDPSDDGFACSELPSEDGTVRVSAIPNTGTGTGPAATPSAVAVALGGIALGCAAMSARARRRTGAREAA
ncbi:MAG: hypothetical protein M3Q10_14610 [Chloroflexota bacterium]|nr:hypothetical protein [Chloroflexota bacterium]